MIILELGNNYRIPYVKVNQAIAAAKKGITRPISGQSIHAWTRITPQNKCYVLVHDVTMLSFFRNRIDKLLPFGSMIVSDNCVYHPLPKKKKKKKKKLRRSAFDGDYELQTNEKLPRKGLWESNPH